MVPNVHVLKKVKLIALMSYKRPFTQTKNGRPCRDLVDLVLVV